MVFTFVYLFTVFFAACLHGFQNCLQCLALENPEKQQKTIQKQQNTLEQTSQTLCLCVFGCLLLLFVVFCYVLLCVCFCVPPSLNHKVNLIGRRSPKKG